MDETCRELNYTRAGDSVDGAARRKVDDCDTVADDARATYLARSCTGVGAGRLKACASEQVRARELFHPLERINY